MPGFLAVSCQLLLEMPTLLVDLVCGEVPVLLHQIPLSLTGKDLLSQLDGFVLLEEIRGSEP